jgi:hypothetical protein
VEIDMSVINLKKLFIFLSLNFVFNLSYSQTFPEGVSCNTREGRIQYIQDYSLKHFDWILKKVERVPPDIEKYLSDEYRDSLKTKNESRLQIVLNNPYYYPWKLRESIQKFQDKVKNGYKGQNIYGSIKKDPHETEIRYYSYLLHGSSDVIDKFDEYKIFDNKRQKPYLNSDEDDNKRFVSRSLLWIVIDGLISCSFKK